MDWRDFMRGFFGSHSGFPQQGHSSSPDVWPPPPPIPHFNDASPPHPPPSSSDQGVESERPGRGRSIFDGEGGVFGGSFGRQRPEGPTPEMEEFGNRFVFGDIFSAMNQMFQDVERSMRDLDNFFGNMRIEDHDRMIPFPPHHHSQPLPPAIEAKPNPPNNKEGSVRDLVLKDDNNGDGSDGGNSNRHYLAKPDHTSDKVDRDLDDLYQKSMLDFSKLPVPNTEGPTTSQDSATAVVVPQPDNRFGGRASSGFQRTFQTFKFINGRWEGETVKEDSSGKHITKFYQDEHGQRHETTEFFPSQNGSYRPIKDEPSSALENSGGVPNNTFGFFQLFDRIFKPRM